VLKGLDLRIDPDDRVAGVDARPHMPGNHVAAARNHPDETAGGTGVGTMVQAQPVHRLDHPGSADQRVLPQRHRRGARMGLLSVDVQFVPALTLGAGDLVEVPDQVMSMLAGRR